MSNVYPIAQDREPERSPKDLARGLKERCGSYDEAARQVGVCPSTMKNWVTGKATPQKHHLDKLLEAAGHFLHPDERRLGSLGIQACVVALKSLEAEEERLAYVMEEIQRSRRLLNEHISRIRREVE